MAVNRDILPYRPCVGLLVVNKHGKILQGERIDTPGAWQMPQGGIDEGEDPSEAALRELYEETSIENHHVKIIDRTPSWLKYDLPDEMIPTTWKGKYRGQKMHWFLLKLEANDSVINIETSHPEFSKWRWVDIQVIPDHIVTFKKGLYQYLVDYFSAKIEKLIGNS